MRDFQRANMRKFRERKSLVTVSREELANAR